MNEYTARAVVDALQASNRTAHVHRTGVYEFGVRIALDGGREAIWNISPDGTVDAQILSNGVLVDYVSTIRMPCGDLSQAADMIAKATYNGRPTMARPAPAQRPAPPLTPTRTARWRRGGRGSQARRTSATAM